MKRREKLVYITKLRAHEEVCPQRLAAVMRSIGEKNLIINPIVVDNKTGVILDGHHRAESLRRLGCRLAPVMAVDYFSDKIRVFSRRKEIKVTKSGVVAKSLKGKLFPYKTTRNWIKGRIRNINISLDRLK